MVEVERLGDHFHARLQEAVRYRHALGIAGDEEDLQIGPSLAGLVGYLAVTKRSIRALERRIFSPEGPSTASSVR